MAYSITFERITEESAEYGDAEERGFLFESIPTLREAVQRWQDNAEGGHVESDECPVNAPRWFTACGERRLRTGDFFNVSLHLPDSVTPASRRRIARLVGCYGA